MLVMYQDMYYVRLRKKQIHVNNVANFKTMIKALQMF